MNKKVLFIALSGYSDGICKKMREMDIDVDYMNDKPNDGVICKTLGRLKVPFYLKYIEKYYQQSFDSYKHREYDFILIIRGEYTPEKSLLLLRELFPKAKLILYMWDSLQNNKGIEKKWKYFDRVITFDRLDYLKHMDEIEFLPLFYYEDYLPSGRSDLKEYDIAFIGTGHGDRVKIVGNVEEQCKKLGLTYFTYVFLPHKLLYLYHKIKNPYYKKLRARDIHYKLLPIEKVYEIYGKSQCIVDIESSTQSGLTMRTIEIIGLKKKLITTNKDIVHYDFYNANNIMVVERDDFVLNKNFFETEYEKLEDQIYQKYALSSWIEKILR